MQAAREKWIDNAKGIAILLVILGHVGGGLEDVFSFRFVYGIHLVMFFLIAGYTSKNKPIDREYINLRFSRLMVPYFVTCFAVLVSDVLNSYFIYKDAAIQTITNIIYRDLLRSFFASGSVTVFGPVNIGVRIGAIWFLPALFFASIFFRLLLNLVKKSMHLGIISACLFALGIISAKFIWLPFSLQSAMMAVIFLWLGYEVRQRDLLSGLKWYHYAAAQVMLLLGIWRGYCNVGFADGSVGDMFLSIPVGLAGCLLIYLLSWLDKHGKVLEFFGKNSLIILCVHLFMLETRSQCMFAFLETLGLGNQGHKWGLMLIIVEIGFAVLLSVVVIVIKKCLTGANRHLLDISKRNSSGRDVEVDIAKGIFIISMIIGHFGIDRGLSAVIYSCHMIAFVFLSGYFYKNTRSFSKTMVRMLKTFILPYGIYVICYCLLNISQWSPVFFRDTFIRYALGMSFSQKLFPHVQSVGNVYFILMLFLVRCIYMLVDRYVKNEKGKWAAVILISLAGAVLGKTGFWLPWSLDVACYTLIFYRLGHVFRNKGLLTAVMNNPALYFVFAPVWVYMIYCGGMEIAVRNYGKYGNYGICIAGAVCGLLLVVQLSSYVSNNLPICRGLLKLAGNGSLYILMVHSLLGSRIRELVAGLFSDTGLPHMCVCLFIQMALGIMISLILELIRKKMIRHV